MGYVSSDSVQQIARTDFPTRWGFFVYHGFRAQLTNGGQPRQEEALLL